LRLFLAQNFSQITLAELRGEALILLSYWLLSSLTRMAEARVFSPMLHPAEVPQIDDVFVLALPAGNHFMPRGI
jgi:hypothetical protein